VDGPGASQLAVTPLPISREGDTLLRRYGTPRDGEEPRARMSPEQG